MNRIKVFLLYFLVLVLSLPSKSQCPTADFNIPTSVCIGENLPIQNTTVNGVSYDWDFCGGDITSTPVVSSIGTINAGATTTGITVINDEEKWYGFVVSRDNGKLFRLEFGNDLSVTPSIKDVGNATDLFKGSEQIDIIKQGNNWYGLLANFSTSKVLLADFGSSLENIPTITEIVTNLTFFSPRGVKIFKEGSDFIAFVGNNNSNLTRLYFGDSMLNLPEATNITISGSSGFFGISHFKECDQNYLILSALSNGRIFRLDFNTSLVNTPSVTPLTLSSTFANPTKLEVIQEGDKIYAVYVTLAGKVVRLDFGSSLNNTTPTVTDLGNFSVLNNLLGLSFKRFNSSFLGFVVEFSSKVVRKLEFKATCSANTAFSSDSLPKNIAYSEAGTHTINLTASDALGNSSSTSKQITVSSSTAPIINFSSENNCLSNVNTFSASITNAQTITSWQWDFGDTQTATGQNVSHQYTTPGTYNVRLSVESENGCGNFIDKEITIYPEPVPDFNAPEDVLCSNNPILFTNRTPGEYDGLVSYSWDFGDGESSQETSPAHEYGEGGTYTVTLTADIPGCSISKSYDIEITPGPAIDFSAANFCLGEEMQFTNLTTGSGITSYAWDFGNGFTSTLQNPAMMYEAPGIYNVTLTVGNEAGCSNIITKPITINALPEVQFINELACTGSPTRFFDRTNITNANIQSWFWDFGDAVSTEKDPMHTFSQPGIYEVKLVVTSTFGCMDSVTQTVEVISSPVAGFEVETGCPGAVTRFTDVSTEPTGSGITSWFWEIGGTQYFEQNPEVLFNSPGTYAASLTVTSGSFCQSTMTQQVVIDPLPQTDFSFDNACLGQATTFSDLSQLLGEDEITSWNWQFGDIATSSLQNPEITFAATGELLVHLTVTSGKGCSASISKTLRVNDVPDAAFSVTKSYGAPPFQVSFTNNSKGATKYQWLFGDPKNNKSTLESPSFVYTSIRDYEVKLVATNASGCTDTARVTINVVNPMLDVALEQINTIMVDGNLQLVLKITNKGSLPLREMDILLDLGGQVELKEQFVGNIGAGESLNHPLGFEISGNKLRNLPYACASISVNEDTYTEENEADNKICRDINGEFVLLEPYPNPVAGTLHVDFIMPEKTLVKLMLIDMMGKAVAETAIDNTHAGLNQYSHNLSFLLPGIYLLKVSHQGHNYLKRVLVR